MARVLLQSSKKGRISDVNWAIFKDFKMKYNNKKNPTIEKNLFLNMEYKFDMTEAKSDDVSAETSLSNLTTLETLVSLGKNPVNIINQPEIKYESRQHDLQKQAKSGLPA